MPELSENAGGGTDEFRVLRPEEKDALDAQSPPPTGNAPATLNTDRPVPAERQPVLDEQGRPLTGHAAYYRRRILEMTNGNGQH